MTPIDLLLLVGLPVTGIGLALTLSRWSRSPSLALALTGVGPAGFALGMLFC